MECPASPANPFSSDTYVEKRPSISCHPRFSISAAALSSSSSRACRLLKSLASLFATPLVCFQSVADSLCKTPGVGYPGQDVVQNVRTLEFPPRLFSRTYELPPQTDRFASPAFSWAYELLFSQAPCF